MTTPESPDNAVLVMAPPWLLLATQPVVDADVGLSLASYDLIPDGEGGMVDVDPPLAGTVDPGDDIWLWLVGDATFLSNASITDVNAKTRLRIPKGRLHPDQLNKLYYTITRGSSNIGKSEPNLTVLYNKIRPGLKDRFPEIDGHSELELLLADDIKNGVGPDFVSARVCVSYPHCRAYDTITLKCNGEIMTYQVRPDEAPQPPNPGSPIPITVCFTVTRAYLESAVRPGGKLDFSYTVTDQCGNTTDTDAVWSATQTVDEDLAGLLLPAALLREQLNDPDDDLSLIDLEKLGTDPLLLIILTADSRFQVGYTVNAVYTATLTGQADVVVRVSGTVEADEFGQKKTVVLEVPNDKVLAGSTVKVTYELRNGMTLVGSSKTATAQVVGESKIDLTAPTLEAPATNPVDALNNRQGVHVRVDFATAQPGDQAQLILVNPLPGSKVFPVLSLAPTFAIFTLDVEFLGLWHGKAAQLRWDLIRNGEVIAQSLALVLTMNRIADEDPRLSTPVIINHTGQVLDVTQLLATDRLRMPQWPLQTKDIPVWLRLDGTLANGQLDPHIIWSGQVHRFEPSDLVIPLTAAVVAWLNSLKDGSTLTITFAVNFDKTVSAGTAVRFPLCTYVVKVLVDVKPEICSVTDSKGDDIPNEGITSDTRVTFSGTASRAQQIQLYNHTSPVGPVVDVNADGSWSQLISGLEVAGHSFTAQALYSEQVSEPRTFRVAPALIMPTTPINLSGFNLSIDGTGFNWPIKADLAGTVAQREANGGIPPIRYQSSDTQIATVDESNGTVRSIRSGTATITARDSINQERSYVVNCSNVYRITINPASLTPLQVAQWVSSINGRIITMGDKVLIETALQAKYAISGPNKWGWTGEAIAGGATTISFHIPDVFYVKIYQTTASPYPGPGVCLVR